MDHKKSGKGSRTFAPVMGGSLLLCAPSCRLAVMSSLHLFGVKAMGDFSTGSQNLC